MQNGELEAAFLAFRERDDMRALARVFDAGAPQLLAIARHLAGRRGEAEDLVQATFLTAIEKAAAYDGSRPLLPWLLGILALHARKQRERAGRELDLERIAERESEAPQARAAERELAAAVDRAVTAMPATYAGVLRRHLVDGAGLGEIAAELGISPGNARVRLHRGLKLLRGALPVGFASAGTAWLVSLRELRSLRRRVLEHASAQTGAAVPSSLAVVPLIVVAIVVSALSAAIWLPRPRTASEETRAGGAVAQVAGESNGGADSTREVVLLDSSPAADAREVVASARAADERAASAPVRTIRGRLLLPGGAPAVGARVELATPIVLEPAWIPPASVPVGDDGSFAIALEPPARLTITLEAKLARLATMQWSWADLASSGDIDLGDATFERAASLAATVVDARGTALTTGWQLELFDASEARVNGQNMIARHVPLSAVVPFVIDDLPPRRYRVRATRGLVAEVPWTQIDAPAERVTELELVYSDPDPARRVGVLVRARAPGNAARITEQQLRLIDAGGRVRTPSALPRLVGRFVFEDVDGGDFELVVDDPRFLPFTRAGVAAGDSLRIELVGAASIALRVRGAGGREVERYGLTAAHVEPGVWNAPAKLLDAASTPPERGVFSGFLPGDARLEIALEGAPAKSVLVEGLRAGEVREVEVNLGGALALTGRVLEQDGARPAAGVVVELTRGESVRSERAAVTIANAAASPAALSVTTADDGSFRFDALEAGSWRVRASWNALLTVERDVSLASDSRAPVELLQPASGSIAGFVEGHAGGARWIAVARTRELDGRERRVEAEIAPDGSFRLGPLPVGVYDVEALERSAPGSGWGDQQTFVSHAAPEGERGYHGVLARRVTRVTLAAPGAATAVLRARVAIEGGSVAGTSLLVSVADRASASTQLAARARIDASGAATVERLRPGTYTLAVASANGEWAWQSSEPLVLRADAAIDVSLSVQLARRRLRVVDGEGAPLAFAPIVWRTAHGSNEARGTTLEHGEILLSLPLGPVSFDCAGWTLEPTAFEWSAGDAPIELRASSRK